MTERPREEQQDASVSMDRSFFGQLNIEFLIHELKDPLSVVETNTRILMALASAQKQSNSRQMKGLQRILRGALKARALLWDLLEVGRAESDGFHCQAFRPEVVLKKTLVEVIDTHAPDLLGPNISTQDLQDPEPVLSRHGICLDIHPSATDVTMIHDETKFSRIVANLLKNAVSYRRNRVWIHFACLRDGMMLSVRDDGPGIAASHHELIFQRYRQIHADARVARSGHGLGLAAARILARKMGGDISLESQLGQGALFRLELPLEFTANHSRSSNS